MDEPIVSQDYKQNEEERVFRYKGYKFVYGPTDLSISEDSRIAEYKYLFRDGIEITKVRGAKKIEMKGILIAGPVNTAIDHISSFSPGASQRRVTRTVDGEEVISVNQSGKRQTSSLQIRFAIERLQDNTSGFLIIPGYGNFIAFLVNSSFTESGDATKELEFSLSFVVSNPNPPITEIPIEFRQTQDQLPDEEKLLIEHVIVAGDTLSAIANRYGVTLGHLKALNPTLFDTAHQNGNLIYAGEVVQIDKSSNRAEVPFVFTPIPPKRIKGNNDIPRKQKLQAYVDNRGIHVVSMPRPTQEWKFYRGSSVGDEVKQDPEKLEQSYKDFQSDKKTTEQKLQEERLRQECDGEPVSKVPANPGVFPGVDGLVQYPESRIDQPIVKQSFISNDPRTVQ